MKDKRYTLISISGYKFVRIYDVAMQCDRFREFCGSVGLQGSVMISPEGINLMLAGSRQQLKSFYKFMKADNRFADMTFKESDSRQEPFDRLRVKHKNHIVPSSVDVDPDMGQAGKISPKTLKQWIEEGREFTLLDTRNTYEIEEGTFDGAVDYGLRHFKDIYQAFQDSSEDMKKKPMVMFCTGGIRCEKGAPLAMEAGFEEVYQLDGGILKYLEDCGQAHYHGKCFVFDQREVVDARDIIRK